MSGRWVLSAAEFDLVWARLGFGEHRYPLEVPSGGETLEERAALIRRVPPVGAGLARALGVLARPRVWVDSVWLEAGWERPERAVAAADGEVGALVVQDGSDEFRVAEVRPASLVSAVLELLPLTPPGRMSATLPAAALGVRAEGYLREAGHWQSREASARETITELLRQPKQASGQLTANGVDRLGRAVRTATVSWFDAPRRHMLLRGAGADGADWITVAGADHQRLRARLTELLDSVRAR